MEKLVTRKKVTTLKLYQCCPLHGFKRALLSVAVTFTGTTGRLLSVAAPYTGTTGLYYQLLCPTRAPLGFTISGSALQGLHYVLLLAAVPHTGTTGLYYQWLQITQAPRSLLSVTVPCPDTTGHDNQLLRPI